MNYPWFELGIFVHAILFLLVFIAWAFKLVMEKQSLAEYKRSNRLMERDWEKWAIEQVRLQDSQKVGEFERMTKMRNQKKRKR